MNTPEPTQTPESGEMGLPSNDVAATPASGPWWTAVLLHVAGTFLVAVLLLLSVADAETLRTLTQAFGDRQFEPQWGLMLLHVALSCAMWLSGWKLLQLMRHRQRRPVRVVRLNRGTVLTETLIALVPFLLLSSGLAQLTVNNIANVMAHLAAYQGARAAWLWVPEIDGGRSRGDDWKVSADEVRRRARLAAAAVMAPTVPANYAVSDVNDPLVKNLRGVMTANFLPGMMAGQNAQGTASMLLTSNIMNQADFRQLNFQGGVDTKSFAGRAAVKLTFAYHALEEGFEVVGISGGNEVGVRLTYQMSQTFPWFAYISGTRKSVGGRIGYYLPMSREYTLRAQIGN